jgi:hypothetical protein
MNIDWRVQPYSQMRYPTSGDWFFSDDGATLHIRVSHLSDRRYEFLLGLHELIEAMLCHFAGVSQKMVDNFDIPYEEAYQRRDPILPCGCPRIEPSDPGNDHHAPYYWQHRIADAAERMVAITLGVTWDDYDREVDKPPQ